MLLGLLTGTTIMGLIYLQCRLCRRSRQERRKLEMSSDIPIIIVVCMRKGFSLRKSARIMTKTSRKFGRTRMELGGVSAQVGAHGNMKYL